MEAITAQEFVTEKKLPRKRGEGRIWQIGRMWWIQYYSRGRQIRESSKSTNERVAEKLLRARLVEKEQGGHPELRRNRIRVVELAEDYLRYVEAKHPHSYAWANRIWEKHIKPVFGDRRAADITTADLEQHHARRLREGISICTANRDLAVLKAMFRKALRATPRKLYDMPAFPELGSEPKREGHIGPAEYAKLLEKCGNKTWLRAFLAMGFNHGFRKGEMLNLRLRHVDFLQKTITLPPEMTKTKRGRVVAMADEVCRLLLECASGKGPEDFLLTRGAKPVRDFRGSWDALCEAAGVHLIPHDLRRSCVIEMDRKGVSRAVQKAIVGHATDRMNEHYRSVDLDDLRAATSLMQTGQISGQETDSTQRPN